MLRGFVRLPPTRIFNSFGYIQRKSVEDKKKNSVIREKGDGIVRISRQTKGRKGKGVTLITGLDLDDAQLKIEAAHLKKICGCGGAVKEGVIEIQGDKRDIIKNELEKKGHKVKFSGG